MRIDPSSSEPSKPIFSEARLDADRNHGADAELGCDRMHAPDRFSFKVDEGGNINQHECGYREEIYSSNPEYLLDACNTPNTRHAKDVVDIGKRSTSSTQETGTPVSTSANPDNPDRLNINDAVEDATKTGMDRATKETSGCLAPQQKYRSCARPRGISLKDLPNEILVHLLSYLSASSLNIVSLVSKQLRNLVLSPHPWQLAFARFFPGREVLARKRRKRLDSNSRSFASVSVSAGHCFTKLLPKAMTSWAEEYTLRARLLECLSRGRPVPWDSSGPQLANRRRQVARRDPAKPFTSYYAQLPSPIDHLDSSFAPSQTSKVPSFIHGNGQFGLASISDPQFGSVQNWGVRHGPAIQFSSWSDSLSDHDLSSAYGLGSGLEVRVPNVMDVSQRHGVVVGDGQQPNLLLFQHVEDRRARMITPPSPEADTAAGTPRIQPAVYCAVWIAKTANVPRVSRGLVGFMTGCAKGILTIYSLGTAGPKTLRLERGEFVAQWAVCPGVPIVRIICDEQVSEQRLRRNRIWVVVLNALGEIFYLTKMPQRNPALSVGPSSTDHRALTDLARITASSVRWRLVPPSARRSRIGPYNDNHSSEDSVDPSVTQPSHDGHWDVATNSSEDINQLWTSEVSALLAKKPIDIRNLADGWDMRRQMHVDFAAAQDFPKFSALAGESITVVSTGSTQGVNAEVKRYTRCSVSSREPAATKGKQPEHNLRGEGRGDGEKAMNNSEVEEWRLSLCALELSNHCTITTSAVDLSIPATTAPFEEALEDVRLNLNSNVSSIPAAPMPDANARFLALGTDRGKILVYDIRGPIASSEIVSNVLRPVRIIQTKSPSITALALTALYLVHGGSDSVLQAWDPLASSLEPIGTFNSRPSPRHPINVRNIDPGTFGGQMPGDGDADVNAFHEHGRGRAHDGRAQRAHETARHSSSIGAIILDPDPLKLRGMLSVSNYLRYWHFSSAAIDDMRTSKRRKVRGKKASNAHGSLHSHLEQQLLQKEQAQDIPTPVTNRRFQDHIGHELREMALDDRLEREEARRRRNRFGIDLLGPDATEEEVLAYAKLLSAESAGDSEDRPREEVMSNDAMSSVDTDPYAPQSSNSARKQKQPEFYRSAGAQEHPEDADLTEAVRRSLLDLSFSPVDTNGLGSSTDATADTKQFPASRLRKTSAARAGIAKDGPSRSLFRDKESDPDDLSGDDLEYALQLSRAEELSRHEYSGR